MLINTVHCISFMFKMKQNSYQRDPTANHQPVRKVYLVGLRFLSADHTKTKYQSEEKHL